MPREAILRKVLWLAAAANVGGAALFAFPAWWPAQLAAFPADAPIFYRAFTALFVLLFGGAYAWLASQPAIDRPFVAFGAIGKACAFLTVAGLWLAGEAGLPAVAVLGADLALAAALFWGLAGGRGAGAA
jgi:hypothetical protein